jgi:hypothetical protein
MKNYFKYILQKIYYGFDDREIYNLDMTIILFLLPRLKRLRELRNYSDTEKIVNLNISLDEIIEAFECYRMTYEQNSKLTVEGYKKIENGFNLFAHCLPFLVVR